MKDLIGKCSICKRIRDTVYESSPFPGMGNENAKLMVVFGTPEIEYVETSIPLSGPGGDKLKKILKYLELTTDDVWITCALKHAFPDNNMPTLEEICNCKSFLYEEVKTIKPLVILLVGQIATEPFFPSKNLSVLRGNIFETKDWPSTFFCVTDDLATISKPMKDISKMKLDQRKEYLKKHKEVEREMYILKGFLGEYNGNNTI